MKTSGIEQIFCFFFFFIGYLSVFVKCLWNYVTCFYTSFFFFCLSMYLFCFFNMLQTYVICLRYIFYNLLIICVLPIPLPNGLFLWKKKKKKQKNKKMNCINSVINQVTLFFGSVSYYHASWVFCLKLGYYHTGLIIATYTILNCLLGPFHFHRNLSIGLQTFTHIHTHTC